MAVAAGLAGVKAVARLGFGPHADREKPLRFLTDREAAIARAAAVAMVGEVARPTLGTGWDPAADLDDLLLGLAEDQRVAARAGLHLLEEWTLGLHGFSSRDVLEQREILAEWRTSSIALQRTVWGLLHAASCSSWSGRSDAWGLMGYPGPCVGTDRSPGQSATFDWNPRVP
jgi:hypothetical protein